MYKKLMNQILVALFALSLLSGVGTTRSFAQSSMSKPAAAKAE